MKQSKDIIVFFILSIILPIPYIFLLYPFENVDFKDIVPEMFLKFNIPTIIAIIMKIIIEFQKDENKIKKLNLAKKILNIISVIYLLLYELFIILVIIVAENLKYAGPWQY